MVAIWTSVMEADLRRLKEAGKTTGIIAAEINRVHGSELTSGAVSSKSTRLGLQTSGYWWTPAMVADLKRLRAEGKSHEQATNEINQIHGTKMTPAAVRNKYRKLVQKPARLWTREMEKELRRLKDEKTTHEEIARRLGERHGITLTRDQVGEKIVRMGITNKITRWTPAMKRDLTTLQEEKLTHEQIATRLSKKYGKRLTGRAVARQAETKTEKNKWTEEMLSDLRRLRNEGNAYEQAKDELNRIHGTKLTEEAVRRKAIRIGEARVQPAWTGEMLLTLVSMGKEGKTASEIAEKLNRRHGSRLNRRAVLGKRHELKKITPLLEDDGKRFWEDVKEFVIKNGTLRAKHLKREKRSDLAYAKRCFGGREAVLEQLRARMTESEKRAVLLRAIDRAFEASRLPQTHKEIVYRTFGFGEPPVNPKEVVRDLEEKGKAVEDETLPRLRPITTETKAKMIESRILATLRNSPFIQDARILVERRRNDQDVLQRQLGAEQRMREFLARDERLMAQLKARAKSKSGAEKVEAA